MSHTTEAILAGTWGEGCPTCSDSGYDVLLNHNGHRSFVHVDCQTPSQVRELVAVDYPTAEIVRMVAHPKMDRIQEEGRS